MNVLEKHINRKTIILMSFLFPLGVLVGCMIAFEVGFFGDYSFMGICYIVLIFFPVIPLLLERKYICVIRFLAEEIALVFFVFQDVTDGRSLP